MRMHFHLTSENAINNFASENAFSLATENASSNLASENTAFFSLTKLRSACLLRLDENCDFF